MKKNKKRKKKKDKRKEARRREGKERERKGVRKRREVGSEGEEWGRRKPPTRSRSFDSPVSIT